MEGESKKKKLTTLEQWLSERGRRFASSTNIVTEFFSLRESVVEPAINDLIPQINKIVPTTVECAYLQTLSGGDWSMVGIRYVVTVGIEREGDPVRCEIEFTASVEDDFIRVRAAQGALSAVGGKKVGLFPRQFSTGTVQRVFRDLLVECLAEDDYDGPCLG